MALTRANYHGDYSWTFQVKDGDAVCAVNRLSLEPEAASATVIGERQTFTASAFGEPDSCSVAGQELTATGYDWSWTNPIADDGDDLAVTVAEWFDGGVVDTDVDGIAAGCTTMCTAGRQCELWRNLWRRHGEHGRGNVRTATRLTATVVRRVVYRRETRRRVVTVWSTTVKTVTTATPATATDVRHCA